MLGSDATPPRQLPPVVVPALSGATRSRTRQDPSDPRESPGPRVRGLHDIRQGHRHRRIRGRVRESARFREDRRVHAGREGKDLPLLTRLFLRSGSLIFKT